MAKIKYGGSSKRPLFAGTIKPANFVEPQIEEAGLQGFILPNFLAGEDFLFDSSESKLFTHCN